MNRTTVFLIHKQSDEDRAIPGPYIPTLGYPTSASDMYSVAGVAVTGHEGWNSCYTDVATCVGLAKIIEGEVTSWADIEAAETALQLLFWHDRIDVIIPGFKSRNDQLVSYTRCDAPRSQLALELFHPCKPYDVIFATEEVVVKDGEIKKSNSKRSTIVGKKLDWAKANYLKITPIHGVIISAIPPELRVPAYFSDPHLQKFQGKRGFSGKFYQTIRTHWDNAANLVPEVEFDIRLPPLLSIVLSRASTRNSIPDVIYEVREEISRVRLEMMQFSEMVKGSVGEAEIEEHCRHIQESFDNTFAASRKAKETAVLPLLRLYKAVKSPLETAIKILNPNYTPSDPHILANRTVTGRMFSRLLATDSMHSIISYFFTGAELRALEREKRQSAV